MKNFLLSVATALRSPMTLAALGACILLPIAISLWLSLNLTSNLILGTVTLPLFLLWLFMASLSDEVRMQTFQELAVTSNSDRTHMGLLKSSLRHLGCEQGAIQTEQLEVKYSSLVSAIKGRIDDRDNRHHELTASAENLYSSSVTVLEQVNDLYKSISTIDVVSVEERLISLENSDEDHHLKEIDSLRKRLLIRAGEIEQADKLLSQNEEALTSMINATTSLSGSKTKLQTVNLDEGVKDLLQVAERIRGNK